jgi:hypothetical protein
MRSAYRIWVGKPEQKDNLDDPDLDGRTILKQILKK